MSRLSVAPLIPNYMVPRPLSSSSKYILKKRHVEILPESQVTYSPSGNSRIVFNVSSATDFLYGPESFFRFELRTVGTANGADDPFHHLNTGGAHALFRRMEIRLPNGTQVELIDDYARWYAINSCASHSKQHVDFVEAASGDSSSWRPYIDPYHSELQWDKSAGKLAIGNLKVAAITTLEDPMDGPIIDYGNWEWGSAKASLQTGNDLVGDASLDDAYDAVGAIWPSRVRVCKNGASDLNTAGFTITMKLFSQFLQQQEIIPLALIQGGFQIVLDLAEAVQALSLHEDIVYSGAETLNYNIVNPRFFASMIQPAESVMKDYISLYNAEKLNYSFMGVRHYLNVQNGANSTMSFPLNVNVRSARSAITVVQNYKANTASQSATNDQSSYGYDATGRFLKAGLQSYQYQAGSDNFPERAVDLRTSAATDDPMMAEAFSHLMLTFGSHGSTLFEPRFPQWEWLSLNEDDSKNQSESFKLIMATRLDRGDDSLVGYDLSINPLNVVLESAAPYTTAAETNDRYIHTYVTFDQVLSISASGVILRK